MTQQDLNTSELSAQPIAEGIQSEQSPLIQRQIAAIDLGSNSFHMVIANVIDNGLQIVSTNKQQVRMADGLNKELFLDAASMQRGLDCLAMFAERLQDFAPENVRIAATYTLRCAKNAKQFIKQAKQVLPYPIEIIPGEEEARLIYLGVAHTQHEIGKKLVIDIGGGSTEIIIGEEFEPLFLRSKPMGCVSYTNKFFANGKLTEKNFSKAILAAQQKLEPVASRYKALGWEMALGASGTVKAIRQVVLALGHEDGLITKKRLKQIMEMLIDIKHIDAINLEGVSEQRIPVFAAGVSILYAIFDSLNIKEMHYSDGALREGLMYEMEDRFQRLDIRMRTAEYLANKHLVDLAHAQKVQQQALAFLVQLEPEFRITPDCELGRMLKWSALLHEVGLSIDYKGFHRHSAYILQYTNMPGFNQEQQHLLAALVRFQRKSLKLKEMPELSLYQPEQIYPLIGMLRLAIIVNAQRNDEPLPEFTLRNQTPLSKKHIGSFLHWQLSCKDKDWQQSHLLLQAKLLDEQEYWHKIGWTLEF